MHKMGIVHRDLKPENIMFKKPNDLNSLIICDFGISDKINYYSEKCGTLIHVHCEEIEEFNHHIFAEHRFKINPMRTVFYGICENCAEQDI